MELTDFGQRFPLYNLGVLHPFLRATIEVGHSGVIFQDTAFHFEIIDASGEGIGHSFENKERKRL